MKLAVSTVLLLGPFLVWHLSLVPDKNLVELECFWFGEAEYPDLSVEFANQLVVFIGVVTIYKLIT